MIPRPVPIPVDLSPETGRDPVEDFHQINSELDGFDFRLGERKQILAANKIDIPEAAASLEKIRSLAERNNLDFYPISAVTRQGVKELVGAVKKELDRIEAAAETEDSPPSP